MKTFKVILACGNEYEIDAEEYSLEGGMTIFAIGEVTVAFFITDQLGGVIQMPYVQTHHL